jgi:hypothetical protein
MEVVMEMLEDMKTDMSAMRGENEKLRKVVETLSRGQRGDSQSEEAQTVGERLGSIGGPNGESAAEAPRMRIRPVGR